MYKLYVVDNTDNIDTAALETCLQYLPSDRRKKALRYRRAVDRNNCIISYGLLLYALYSTYGICDPVIAHGPKGKPFLLNYPDIHFNVSHCAKGCICGISDAPIGVDIQDIRPFSQGLAERCCSLNELKLITQASDPSSEFIRIWTMKESYLKMTGEGITTNLSAVDTTNLTHQIQTFTHNGCYITVANSTFLQEELSCLI